METIQDTPVRLALSAGPETEAANIAVVTTDRFLVERLRALLPENRFRLSPRRRSESIVEMGADRRVDVVLVDLRLLAGDRRAEIGRQLRGVRSHSRVPTIALCDSSLPERGRLMALEGGFWDVIEMPTGSLELVAKVGAWIGLKRGVECLRAGYPVDAETGGYTPHGIRKRLREMAMLAQRMRDPLSCVVFGADRLPNGLEVTAEELGETGRHFALALHHQTRSSDVIGRLEPLKFLAIAPHTPVAGGAKLAERFTGMSMIRHLTGAYPVTFSAGVAGVEDPSDEIQGQPEMLLTAALKALSDARAAGRGMVVVAREYDGQTEASDPPSTERGTRVEERA